MDVNAVHQWMRGEQQVPKADTLPIYGGKLIVALIGATDAVATQVREAVGEIVADTEVEMPPINEVAEIVWALMKTAVDHHKVHNPHDPMVEAVAQAQQVLQDAYTRYVNPAGLPD